MCGYITHMYFDMFTSCKDPEIHCHRRRTLDHTVHTVDLALNSEHFVIVH